MRTMERSIPGRVFSGVRPGRWARLLVLLGLFIISLTLLGHAQAQDATALPDPSPSRAQAAVPTQGTVTQIATSSALPGVIVVGLKAPDGTLYVRYSLDGGHTWRAVRTTPWGNEARGIGIAPRANPRDPLRIMVWKHFLGALYRSGDLGVTWSEEPFPAYYAGYMTELTASPADPQRLYLAAQSVWVIKYPGCFPLPCDTYYSYVYTSDDAGVTWHEGLTREMQGLGPVVPSPVLPTRAYVGNQGSWIELDTGRSLDFPIDTLALDSVDLDRMYGAVYTYTHSLSLTFSEGKTSINGGSTWTSWPSLPSDCLELLAHPTKSGTLYLQCASGLYRSTDLGDNWEQISTVPGGLIAPNYAVPGQLLWAREDGLWASSDDGTHWTPLTSGWELHEVYLPLTVRQSSALSQSSP